MKKILLVVALGIALGGCAANKGTSDKDAQITQDWPVEKLYAEAQDELNSSNYTRAVKLYELLESRFPQGRYAQQAQLDTAYAYYKDEEREKALAAVERFQRLHPQHPNMDYALYLKGLILFNEDKSFLNKLASQDWSDRDPKANREAYQALPSWFNAILRANMSKKRPSRWKNWWMRWRVTKFPSPVITPNAARIWPQPTVRRISLPASRIPASRKRLWRLWRCPTAR